MPDLVEIDGQDVALRGLRGRSCKGGGGYCRRGRYGVAEFCLTSVAHGFGRGRAVARAGRAKRKAMSKTEVASRTTRTTISSTIATTWGRVPQSARVDNGCEHVSSFL